MSIREALQNLYTELYIGNNLNRDMRIITDYFFPSLNESSNITLDYLAIKHGLKSRERIRQIINNFLKKLSNSKESPIIKTNLRAVIDEINIVLILIQKNENFISLNEISKILDLGYSLTNLEELIKHLGLELTTAKRITIGKEHFYVPNDISKNQIDKAISLTVKKANKLGSVLPIKWLIEDSCWNFLSKNHRSRCIKEIMKTNENYVELVDGNFIGFKNLGKDRLRSRLVKIFSFYEKVPVDNVIDSFYRTIKKTLSSHPLALKILEENRDAFEEFCVVAGYCQVTDKEYFEPTSLLKKLKEDANLENDLLLNKDWEIAKAIFENKRPMTTKEFASLATKLSFTKTDKTYFRQSSILFYRTGYPKNSHYHTLDDRYKSQNDQSVYEKVKRYPAECNLQLRDNKLVKKIKRLCEDFCQICGDRIEIGDEEYYSEVHHLQRLGNPDNGPDVLENMLCVCPNCHVKLDYYVIKVDLRNLRYLDRHKVEYRFVQYHNDRYAGK